MWQSEVSSEPDHCVQSRKLSVKVRKLDEAILYKAISAANQVGLLVKDVIPMLHSSLHQRVHSSRPSEVYFHQNLTDKATRSNGLYRVEFTALAVDFEDVDVLSSVAQRFLY